MTTRSYALATVVVGLVVAAGIWLQAAPPDGAFGQGAANPAYIVVNTPTSVTFTNTFPDSRVKKRSVLLTRVDAAGKASDIIGRMRDDGKNGDLRANDNTYTLRTSLKEGAVGTVDFRVAARFKLRPAESEDDGDDWDADLTSLNAQRPANRRDRLILLLLKLLRYQVSGPVKVTVDPFALPPDPGEAGRQTLPGIDSDTDGVRDDVQRFIMLNYQTDRIATELLLRYARTSQLLLSSGGDSELALRLIRERDRISSCWDFRFPDIESRALQSVEAEILNTRQRLAAEFAAASALDGRIVALTASDEGRASCLPLP